MKFIVTNLLLLCLLAAVSYSRNIIEVAGGGSMSIVEKITVNRSVTTYSGSSTSTGTLECAFFRYTAPRQNLPLLVMCIEWGGTIDQTEGFRNYENEGNDPWITLVIMPSGQTSNWYWGNKWTDGNGKKWTVPWTHKGVIDVINQVKYGNLVDSVFPGCTIDTNRIYAYGHSIGGTAVNQLCTKHPEIFAAYYGHAGWTRYYGVDNNFFSDDRGCLAFASMIGGIDTYTPTRHCEADSNVWIQGNADQTYLPLSATEYRAFLYTDLGWYFGKTGNDWNYRDPSFPTPFCFFANGNVDDPNHQGDNLQPSMELSKRGYQYQRISGGHSEGGGLIMWRYMRNFRKNVSYPAFTNRNYGLQDFSATGKFNDLSVHGWDPDSITDEANHYHIKLTGTGTSDVTLRRLQNLVHTPGTTYDVTINNSPAAQVTADQWGLITIPSVADAASIDLVVNANVKKKVAGGLADAALEVNPNPFNPSAKIVISSLYFTSESRRAGEAGGENAKIDIYNAHGKLVQKLAVASCQLPTGIVWNASTLPSGIYLVQLKTRNAMVNKKVCLLK